MQLTMRPVYLRLCAAIALTIVGCSAHERTADASGSGADPAPAPLVEFVVIGDTPYGEEDEKMLAEAVPAIKVQNPPFIIHIGDYKGGRAPCTDDHDVRHQELIASLAPIPVFYTPGDNEWTDCDRHINEATGERYSDLARLDRVRELFFSTPPAVIDGFGFRRQDAQPENANWTRNGVHFATLHVTGTNNGRDWVTGDPLQAALAAVTTRDANNMEWLGAVFDRATSDGASAIVIAMQADMGETKGKTFGEMCTDVAPNDDGKCDAFADLRADLVNRAANFAKPVLLIHGDTAPFELGTPFGEGAAPGLRVLNAAGDTGPTYGTRDVTLVQITPGASEPFAARGLLTGNLPRATKR